MCDQLERELGRGVGCAAIHGDKVGALTLTLTLTLLAAIHGDKVGALTLILKSH